MRGCGIGRRGCISRRRCCEGGGWVGEMFDDSVVGMDDDDDDDSHDCMDDEKGRWEGLRWKVS